MRRLSSCAGTTQVEAELVLRLDGAIREMDRLLAEHDALRKRLHDALRKYLHNVRI